MDPGRWQQVERLYHAALAHSPDERGGFLVQACAGDDALRHDVESLLHQPASAEGFLDGPAVAMAGGVNDPAMSVMIGRLIGTYHVQALIGAGGMGEVYRARDTKLGRDVAIKILPRAFTNEPDRLTRFEREARMLAALNHPNIGAIYGLEEAGGIPALVLEFVDGETLAERIARSRGPRGSLMLPAEVLAIARQIADALDAAHEKGIIHRDLKPANIKITSDGVVKVLDFGLAKASVSDSMAGAASGAPTMTIDGTHNGTVLGTAAYMSPEQARGLPVDKRTDIWAFGCVLYEMLAGEAAFSAETISDTIVAVLEREPNWTALPAATPRHILRSLERCLEKDLRRRLRDIGDARMELDEKLRPEPTGPLPTGQSTSPMRRRWRAVAVAAMAVLAAAAATFALTTASFDTSSYSFVPLAAEPADETSPSWSPDGKSIVYVAELDGVRQLFTRSLDSAVSTQITKSSIDCASPFWSSDGTRIYFISLGAPRGQLWSVGATGGEAQLVLNDAAAAAVAPDGKTLAFLRGPGGSRSLWLTSLAKLDPQQYRTPPFPETFGLSSSLEFSRDGTKIGVLIRRQEGTSYTSELWVVPYPSGTPRRVLERIPDAAESRLSWAPDNAHIVWNSFVPNRGAIHLYLADTDRSTIRQITSGTVNEQSPSVSPNGERIAFAAGSDDFDLVEVPLDGSAVHTLLASARSETRPTWSPTGTQLGYVTNAQGPPEIWLRSIKEGWARPVVKRESEGPTVAQNLQRPTFSPDGQRIAYEVIGAKHAVWVASVADGRGVPLDGESLDQHSPAWSPDGNWIAYQRLKGESWELVKTPLSGGTPVHLAEATPGGGDHTAWSPTGEWIAHVREGALRLTSADGQTQKALSGQAPAAFGFSLDGSLLYAVRHAPDNTWVLVAFDVQSGQERKVTPVNLPPKATLSGFSLHPDGKRFATGIGIARHDIWLLEGFEQPSRWFRF